jgi:PAS domain-containing protein
VAQIERAQLFEDERRGKKLDRVFDVVADGLAIFDPQGRIVHDDPARRRLVEKAADRPGFAQMPLAERIALFAARDLEGRPLRPD